MPAKFGTSGLRGLVTDLTPEVVRRHVQAFLTACDTGNAICLGQDLRPSSPRIAADITAAAHAAGCRVIDCGAVPTPALALAADAAGAGAVMVTGSHIPADRNGLKFYARHGEITKADEAAILAALRKTPDTASHEKPVSETHEATIDAFASRYRQGFGAGIFTGRRIGVYSHSAVGRDLLIALLGDLGAEVLELGRSDSFIPVDTEAVDPATRTRIADWVQTHALDALMSTDGDSDRPLLADEKGRIVPGDIMGQITADTLGAERIVTPISSNSGVTMKGFARVARTRIGSPYVIAGMAELGGKVAGYEANGGFLLGFEAQGPAGPMAPLMTRDCILPLLTVLHAAAGGPLSARVAAEPPVTTLADRLQNIAQDRSAPFVDRLAQEAAARAQFLEGLGGREATCDLTDGVRMTLTDGRVIHIRPSGNAPELRLYVEAATPAASEELLKAGLAQLAQVL